MVLHLIKLILGRLINGTTHSSVLLPDPNINIQKTVQGIVKDVVGNDHDIRTQDYFSDVMSPAFGVTTFWYRQEFAESRGMVHWHGLCWKSDREPHNLLSKAIEEGLSDSDCSARLADRAATEFGLTASHSGGKDENGLPNKQVWPPHEGTAPMPPEEKNPLIKLLMDVSSSQESLLEDHLLLTNRFNIHAVQTTV